MFSTGKQIQAAAGLSHAPRSVASPLLQLGTSMSRPAGVVTLCNAFAGNAAAGTYLLQQSMARYVRISR